MNKIEINSVVEVGSGFLKRVRETDNINNHWFLSDNQELSNKEIRKHNNKLRNKLLTL